MTLIASAGMAANMENAHVCGLGFRVFGFYGFRVLGFWILGL